ncbi:MAG TPA: hypothetical protein VGA37_06560 [Gemmatimonadales bacterium]
MKRLLLLSLGLAGCGRARDPENSAVCGFANLAASSLVIDHFQGGTTVLDTPPTALTGVVPARVVGRGTMRAIAAPGPGGVVLGYEGAGFPVAPGFALALVDDSTEVFRGVLIFDSDGPADYPQIGTISSDVVTLPLYGMRIRWAAVSDERCPLFATPRDTTP